ncbi:DUF58 domain-containing protein [Paenibacillus sp. 1011MAR3C5]|uniref:DUF58 domain-containing protein n=1 Tax=Paenibacillus sp. 1011MAR3C5 TaxID=1675787 RepID=UPI000E6C15B8|nr:DUF58 domain-containing protein [Paenibacillus sp. 1011MAR3C5]RJE90212.1 DUF58 domain-containing protein [Paenibacillus sp. 1011MAR3C5]
MYIFWFLLFTLAVIYGQGRMFKRLALRKLSYSRKFRQHTCFAGDEIELVEQLENRKSLPVPWLRVESQLPAQLQFRQGENIEVSSGSLYQNHRSFFSLGSYKRLTRTHSIKALKRGCYRLNSVTMTGGDLLGVFLNHTQFQLNDELVVYPRPADVPFHLLPSRSMQGEYTVKRFIVPDPFVVAGSREYQPGDSMKQINWKASARTGGLQVHQYDYTAERNILILLNVEDSESMWRSVSNEPLIERGIEWAAGIANAAIVEGMAAGFAANMPIESGLDSARIESSRGHEHMLLLLEVMAMLQLSRTVAFKQLLEHEASLGYSDRDIVILSAYWNDSLELASERLRAGGNSVTVWEIPSAKSDPEHAEASVKAREGMSA